MSAPDATLALVEEMEMRRELTTLQGYRGILVSKSELAALCAAVREGRTRIAELERAGRTICDGDYSLDGTPFRPTPGAPSRG